MIRQLTLGLVAVAWMAGIGPLAAQTPAGCDPSGRWINADETVTIALGPAGGKWFGRVVKSSDSDVPPGFAMLKDFVRDPSKDVYEGRVARPSGQEAQAEITCEKDGTLKVVGHVGFMARTIVWHREPLGRSAPIGFHRKPHDPGDEHTKNQPPAGAVLI